MTNVITIPPEVLAAARTAFTDAVLAEPQPNPIEAAIRAALAAWPGMKEARNGSSISLHPHIILPLPQESRDE